MHRQPSHHFRTFCNDHRAECFMGNYAQRLLVLAYGDFEPSSVPMHAESVPRAGLSC
jgi:hypothetical protein